jgi:predicted phosphodiesterase
VIGHQPQTIIIGDVHGCLAELDALLRKVRYTRGDRLVLVGDLVAKGPDSAGVVARARELGALAVRGNHDERVLSWFRAEREGRSLDRPLSRGHRLVCATLEDEDVAWLEGLPLSLRLPEHRVTVVHAGLRPGVALAKQDPTHLLNMRSLCADGRVSFRADEGVPWASRWTGTDLVVFGHDAIRGLQRYEQAIGLDTGCVYGGQLTALLLPSRRLVSVNARRSYKEIV